jgi:hypothetical protein
MVFLPTELYSCMHLSSNPHVPHALPIILHDLTTLIFGGEYRPLRRYELGSTGIESRWGARFSAPAQTCPGGHPASYTMGTALFSGVKRPGRCLDHPPPLGPRLKTRARLPLHSSHGSSWHVPRLTLLDLHMKKLFITQFSPVPGYLAFLGPNMHLSTVPRCSFLNVREQVSHP